MAEAARTTKHYVSDSLAERYPYDSSKGFAGARLKTAGTIFNGYDTLGTNNLMHSLTDPFVSAEGKAKAVHHLYNRSAAQETKIDLLQQGLVPLLVATLNSSSEVLLRHQCLLLLRSLAVLPQGCFALIFQGAIAPTVRALRTTAPVSAAGQEDEAVKCRVAAAHVLHQVSSNVSGLRWLLGLPHEEAVPALEADHSVMPLLPEELVHEVADVLADSGAAELAGKAKRDDATVKMVGYLLQTLAQLTSQPSGVEALLASSAALPTVATYLKKLTEVDASAKSEQGLGESALVVIWNLALDRAGETALEAAGVPKLLFDVFASVCTDTNASSVSLQRQLTGALSAVHQLTSVKLASTGPLSAAKTTQTRIEALVHYLRQWNETIDAQYSKLSKPVPSGVAAIQRNTVQCIRLASEVKAVRDVTHAIIDERERADATEAFYLRRQLYFHTKWEAEFHAGI